MFKPWDLKVFSHTLVGIYPYPAKYHVTVAFLCHTKVQINFPFLFIRTVPLINGQFWGCPKVVFHMDNTCNDNTLNRFRSKFSNINLIFMKFCKLLHVEKTPVEISS